MSNNQVDLSKFSVSQVYAMLRARSESKRFLSDKERDTVIDAIAEYDYGWLQDDRFSEVLDSLSAVTVDLCAHTDAELIEELKEMVEEKEYEFYDNTELERIYHKYVVDKAVEQEVLGD